MLVLAGGAGGRLELLTRESAKPAVAFAGTHRLIDFPLSNAHNAGLHDVWVVQQFNSISLSDHLANGRPWDLDRTNGGLLIRPPRRGHDEREGFAGGTADALRVTRCRPRWCATVAYASIASTASGATWAPSTPTGRVIRSSSTTLHRSISTIPGGRSSLKPPDGEVALVGLATRVGDRTELPVGARAPQTED